MISVVLIAVEMERGNFAQWFLFLNFGWGKVYLYSFLSIAILSFPVKSWLSWIISAILIFSSLINLFISRKHSEKELERIRKVIENI